MMRLWIAIPNFVDCEVFQPIAGGRQAIRANLGIPEDAFVIGCVAAVKKHHKRIDYLINEFARLSNDGKTRTNIDRQDRNLDTIIPKPSCISCPSMLNPYLLIAGARTDETAELIALAESLIPGRYKIVTDLRRSQMPDLLRSMDVFVLTSLFEMMPIALLEALASGLPCVVNHHPVLEWMTGVSEEKSIEQKSQRAQSEENCISAGGGKKHSSFASFATSVQTSSAGGKSIDMRQEGASGKSIEQKSQRAQSEENCVSAGGGKKHSSFASFATSVQTSSAGGKSIDMRQEGASGKSIEQKSQRAQSEENCVSAEGGKNHSSFASFATSVQTSSAGGMAIDMSNEGSLAAALAALTPEWLTLHGHQARERALAMFSTEAVIGEYVKYYEEMMSGE